ncbi:MAG: NAD(P) transhydrogenase subunit alpha [Omnitrophica WOR_2 bacterium RIFCSPLOWO2_12_FULL_50_9]|nr:MAG: NAD(P) transhydrogenase subunit alpha [Omnitrophica WOR_2 bacterium RIFCSPHIGHO2_02_FULL_50_17]OGX41632.1 MAG: NAD(P) transhydrogenase subunit alpha [Omnitrophica WOR_2 bacterium RIFCSPLOWO2_12_FULL_50_9]
MIIGIPKEIHPGERRVPLIPSCVDRLVKKGANVHVEQGLGTSIHISDEQYQKAGAKIVDRRSLLSSADIILRFRKPPLGEIGLLKKGSIHISFLDPFNEASLIEAFLHNHISAISMEMIPRTTLAQKMDALSSQANLAGYVSVILAAERLNKIIPMMTTPAGTIAPARVFIIGAGVAGLQAIATARRLGARVEAFDTRPVVEEQVHSLGAKFVKIDLGETGQTKDGYAKALTPEQLQKQREGMAKVCAYSDIVITTAQVFGRKAPVIVTEDMVTQMQPGSVVVDMAVETGGNVEGSQLDKEVEISGVRVIGLGNLPGHVAVHASQMYSNNLMNLIESFWNTEQKAFVLDAVHEIIKGCLITHQGQIVNGRLKNF